MKKLIFVVAIGTFFLVNNYMNDKKQDLGVEVMPIMHATMVLKVADSVIYVDPTGEAKAFEGKPAPTIILLTDIHSDHLSTSTLTEVIKPETALIVPQAVKDLLPKDLAERATVLKNGDFLPIQEMKIEAVPMYNLPESQDAYHVKGRGNGYIIGSKHARIYIAGDTAGTPEMRALKDIDIAFVPMNLPYTMDVEEAASAVLQFKPKQVYPYHYRGQNGLTDVSRFKELVNKSNPDIEVILLNWYPN